MRIYSCDAVLHLCVGDSTSTDRFSQSSEGHCQGEHGGALRRKRQRQTVAIVREGSEDHSRLISSMIAASAICEVVDFDGVFGNLGVGLRLETELLI